MNNQTIYNTAQGRSPQEDYRNIPIANLDSVYPLEAPGVKVSSLDVSSGSSYEIKPSDDDDTNSELSETPSASRRQKRKRPERKRCGRLRRLFILILTAFQERPGLRPWALSSVSRVAFSWRSVSFAFEYARPLFGIDEMVEAAAYHAIVNQTAELGKHEELCIQFGAAKCRQKFSVEKEIELAMIQSIQFSNERKIQAASDAVMQCLTRVNATETALQRHLFSQGTLPFVETNDQCSPGDLLQLRAIARGEARQDQDDISSEIMAFLDETGLQLEYMKNWGIYNRDYFFGVIAKLEADILLKINEFAVSSLEGITLLEVTGLNGFDGIIACTTPEDERASVCKLPDLSMSLEEVHNLAKAYIAYGEEQITTAAMVIATLIDRYDWAVGNLQEFVRIFTSLRNVLGRPFDLAFDRFGGGIDLDQFANLLPGYLYVPGNLDLADIPELPSLDPLLYEFIEAIYKLKKNVRAVAEQVSDELAEKVDEFKTDVKNAFAKVYDDYNPPKHHGFETFQQVANGFAEKGQDLVDHVSAKVNKIISGTTSTMPDALDFVPPAAQVALNATSAHVQEARATIPLLAYPNIPEWVWKYGRKILDYFWLMDYIRIAWIIVRRFREAWEGTSVPVPVIRMPTTDEEEARVHRGKCMTVVALITHDVFLKIWKVVSSLAALALLLGLYFGFVYQHYIDGCVNSKDGTYLGRELLTNVVSTRIVVDVLTTHEAESKKVGLFYQENCESARIGTFPTHIGQENQLEFVKNEYSQATKASNQLVNCIDFGQLGDYRSGLTSCTAPMDIELEQGIATCEWGDCEFQCEEDMLAEKIQRLIVENACKLEGQYHGFLWCAVGLLMAWYSLKLLSDAIEDLPPHLFPKTCGSKFVKMELERNQETRELLGSEGEEAEIAMDKAVATTLFWNKVKACGQLSFIILCNAAWIALLCINVKGILNN